MQDRLILELQFGEGGDDSKLFVEDLARAYIKWAQINNLEYDILDWENGHISLEIIGKNVLKYFQNESGKHCVQRVPPTERRGRKQTSMISVAVLPIRDEYIPPFKDSDLEIKCQTGSQKAGGQNVNKVNSAVRMKHIPTGLSVFINGRDQHHNKKLAKQILSTKVEEYYSNITNSAYNSERKKLLGDTCRSGKTRTYNFTESRVVDHKTGKKTTQIDKVMRGRFDLIA